MLLAVDMLVQRSYGFLWLRDRDDDDVDNVKITKGQGGALWGIGIEGMPLHAKFIQLQNMM